MVNPSWRVWLRRIRGANNVRFGFVLLFSSVPLSCLSFQPLRPCGIRARLQRGSMMAQYPRMDPYQRSRYEQGIDAKIVVMGNTGMSQPGIPPTHLFAPQASYFMFFTHHTGVGKTSLLHRYTQNKFDPKNTTSTTGAFFVTKKVYVDGLKVRLQLWDTAGQERFRSMVSFVCFSTRSR